MKVPYRNLAYVPREKIEKYIISTTHPQGKYKAVVFRSRGFDESNIHLLEEELIRIIKTCDIITSRVGPTWVSYGVNGTINTPDGRTIPVTTAWTVNVGKRSPRLVSAYPV